MRRLRAGPGAIGAICLAILLGGCDASGSREPARSGTMTLYPTSTGDARHGADLIAYEGCGACHSIPGIPNAHGRVGPPLDNIGARTIIAGLLPNTPENMVAWLKAPQRIVPGNAMPNMELNDDEARDIAAYLFTLH